MRIYKYIYIPYRSTSPVMLLIFKTEVLKTGRYKKCRPALPTPDGRTTNHPTAKSGGLRLITYHTGRGKRRRNDMSKAVRCSAGRVGIEEHPHHRRQVRILGKTDREVDKKILEYRRWRRREDVLRKPDDRRNSGCRRHPETQMSIRRWSGVRNSGIGRNQTHQASGRRAIIQHRHRRPRYPGRRSTHLVGRPASSCDRQ